MGDVAQILAGQLGSSQAPQGKSSSLPPPPPPPPASHHPSRAMKMAGMSREVMDLLSGNQDKASAALPPIVPSIPPAKDTTVKVGNKYISASKPARKWVWAPFASSARTDGALFRHWVRAGVEYPDYPYARFDVHLNPVTYTHEEYTRFLQDETWTKSETDKLVELARVFELRWAVICDRWCDTYPQRKVEELQHRYYSVAATLLQQRVAKEAASEVATISANAPVMDPTMPPDQAKALADSHLMETAAARALASAQPKHQPLMANLGTGSTNKNVFDLEKERERRAHMEVIWHRTKEEEQEEVALRKELRLVEAQIRKLKKSGGHILAASAQPQRGAVSSAASSQNPSRSVSPVPTSNIDAGLLDQCFASTAPTPMPGTPYLQSGRLAPPATGGPIGINKTTLKRMDTVLEELKIPRRPLPTKRVCDLYDVVRKDALTLITLQKMVIQKEAQLQNKRLRLAKMGGGRVVDEETLLGIAPPPAPAPAPAPAPRQKSTGAKTKKPAKSKAKSAAAGGGEAGKGDKATTGATATSAKGTAAKAASAGGKAAPGGKAGRKTGTKRKKKSEKSTAASAVAAASQSGGDSAAAPTAAKTVSQGDAPAKQPSKKRARKS